MVARPELNFCEVTLTPWAVTKRGFGDLWGMAESGTGGLTTAYPPYFRLVPNELAIHHLIARIAHLADGGSVDDYVACFTEDARWDMPGAPRRGRAAIRAGTEERRAAGDTGPGSHTRHVIGSIDARIDRDTATARSYWQFWARTDAGPQLRLMGQYDDTFVRDGDSDSWLLSARAITFG